MASECCIHDMGFCGLCCLTWGVLLIDETRELVKSNVRPDMWIEILEHRLYTKLDKVYCGTSLRRSINMNIG